MKKHNCYYHADESGNCQMPKCRYNETDQCKCLMCKLDKLNAYMKLICPTCRFRLEDGKMTFGMGSSRCKGEIIGHNEDKYLWQTLKPWEGL